jgi:hypothetical protein
LVLLTTLVAALLLLTGLLLSAALLATLLATLLLATLLLLAGLLVWILIHFTFLSNVGLKRTCAPNNNELVPYLFPDGRDLQLLRQTVTGT